MTYGTRTYTYDLNGNLTTEQWSDSDGVMKNRAYSWDYDNRLTSVYMENVKKSTTNQADSHLDFKYDPDNMRITKEVYYSNTLKKKRTYVAGKEEYNENGDVISIYLGPIRITSNGSMEYKHKDVLGSTVLITDGKRW